MAKNIIDLAELNFKEISAVMEDASKRMEGMIAETAKGLRADWKAQEQELQKAFKAQAEEMGLVFDDVLGVKKKTKSTRKPARPKYQNPNGDQTWTGKGRQPKWVAEHVSTGGKLEDLLITA